MEINKKNLREINFNIKRSWWLSFIVLFILGIIIGVSCYIELNLKKIHDGLTSELETFTPIFYGIISLFLVVFYLFVAYYIFISHKEYLEDIKNIPHLSLFFWLSYFLPTIFCYIISRIINNYLTNNVKKRKSFFKKQDLIPYDIIIKSYESYQDQHGNWWYKDDNNNYYKANENGEWVKIK